eukprot:bmy_19918T0
MQQTVTIIDATHMVGVFYQLPELPKQQHREDSNKKEKENQGDEIKVSSHLKVGTTTTSVTSEDSQKTLNHNMAQRQKQVLQQLKIHLFLKLSRANLSK